MGARQPHAFDGSTDTYARSKLSGEVLVFEPAGGIKFDNTLKVGVVLLREQHCSTTADQLFR